MRFVAIGRTQWLHRAIEMAVERGHQCALIVTAQPSPEYRLGIEEFRATAERLGVPCLSTEQLGSGQMLQTLSESRADVALSVNWPSVIPKRVRDIFPNGIWNAHCGDLPRYRGNACPNWAILAGEPSIAVSIHVMAEELDAGPLLLQDRLSIDQQSYIGDVYQWLDVRIPQLFSEALDGVTADILKPKNQPTDPNLGLRCYPRTPVDAFIDWNQPAEKISRLIRASAEPFSGAFTFYRMELLRIWRGREMPLPTPSLGVPGQVISIDRRTGCVGVLAGENMVLIQTVSLAEQPRTAAASILNSTRDRLGVNIPHLVQYLRQLTGA